MSIKTNHMLLAKFKKIPCKLHLVIDNGLIGDVNKTKCLGVSIDDTLSWEDPILYIYLEKYLMEYEWWLRLETIRIKFLLPLQHSFLYSYFTYCDYVGGAMYKSNLKRRVILQNEIVGIVSRVEPRGGCESLYGRLVITKFECINNYHRNQELHNYSIRTAYHFHIPLV